MGNNISTVGDLFFPDNPNRRCRAQELQQQILTFGEEFKELQATRENKLNNIRSKLDGLMRSKGFETSQQLEDSVKGILNGEELARYARLKNLLDLNDKVQGIIWDLSGIAGLASGIILGVGVLAGLMTGGAALAALGVVGEVLAIVAIIVVVFGVIEGAIERSKLRDAINELWPQRVKIKQAVEQMRVIVQWVDAIEVWLDHSDIIDTKTLDALLDGSGAGFEPQYRSWTIDHTCDMLAGMDRANGSWTNEDPGRGSLPPQTFFTMAASEPIAAAYPLAAELGLEKSLSTAAHSMVVTSPVAELLITDKADSDGGHDNATEPKSYKFVYRYLVDQTSCVVECGGKLLKIKALQYSEENTRLESTLFSIESVPSRAAKLAASLFVLPATNVLTSDGCKIHVAATSTT